MSKKDVKRMGKRSQVERMQRTDGMDVLVACEFSGIVREAFKSRGHNAVSCDLRDTEIEGSHYRGDVRDILDEGWGLMIAHPPCTYLAVTGNKWFYHPEDKHLPVEQRRPHPRFPDRREKQREAIKFFMDLVNAPIEKICIENPVGIMSTVWRKPDQYIHPFMFGEPHSKKTGLWLKNLPELTPTKFVEPEMYTYENGRKDPMWHVKSMGLPKEERTKVRSVIFKGVAEAMAEQWGARSC